MIIEASPSNRTICGRCSGQIVRGQPRLKLQYGSYQGHTNYSYLCGPCFKQKAERWIPWLERGVKTAESIWEVARDETV